MFLKLVSVSGCLNWWCSDSECSARRLLPLATSGDGNCLLHAASLSMWGIHDRLLTLRQALHYTLADSPMAASLRRRWTYDIELRNKEAGGLVYSLSEWDKEWDEVLRLSSCQERVSDSSQPHYESLEEIHVFALAHVLHRPVIVISDKFLRDFDNVPIAPIYFRGVYLPLEHHPTKCSKTPLLLTYEASHFSALVSMEIKSPENVTLPKKGLFGRKNHKTSPLDVIPLQTADGSLLPVHFSIDRENLRELASIRKTYSNPNALGEMKDGDFNKYQLKLMRRYMDVTEFDVMFVCEEPSASPVSPDTPSGDGESVASTEGITPSLQRQHSQHSTGQGSKKMSFFSALATGFRFGNNKLKLPPDTRALGAKLDMKKRPPHYEDLIANYLESARERYVEALEKKRRKEKERDAYKRRLEEKAASEAKPCRTSGCDMYGTAQTDFLCSRCYVDHQQHHEQTHRPVSSAGASPCQPTSLVRRDTPGLGGHYDVNQSSPSWSELSTNACPRRVQSAFYSQPHDLRQYAGYYPDSGQTATHGYMPHRHSISYPHTRSQTGFTDAGKEVVAKYGQSMQSVVGSPTFSQDKDSYSSDDDGSEQITHV